MLARRLLGTLLAVLLLGVQHLPLAPSVDPSVIDQCYIAASTIFEIQTENGSPVAQIVALRYNVATAPYELATLRYQRTSGIGWHTAYVLLLHPRYPGLPARTLDVIADEPPTLTRLMYAHVPRTQAYALAGSTDNFILSPPLDLRTLPAPYHSP